MTQYQTQELRKLRDQLLFAPRAVRAEQADRAERFLAELDEDKRYPFELICYRVTNYRPRQGKPVALPGDKVKGDLRALVHDLSDGASLTPAEVDEPVLTIQDIARQYNVSEKTVSRWRRLGLVSRRFVFDGRRKRVGFLRSSVDRFVREHSERVERGSRFRQLTDEEKEEVIRRARRLASRRRCCVSEIVRRVSRKMNRSPETIRYTIRAYDKAHPDDPVFQGTKTQLSRKERDSIYRAFRQGVPVSILARRFCRTRSSAYRAINECRARQLLKATIGYIYSPEFEGEDAEATILGAYPERPHTQRGRPIRPPAGLPPYLAGLYETPLLTREQEAHLFRKMNYLKYKAARLRERLDPVHPRVGLMDEIQHLREEALAVKNQIIRANLRLVVSIAKRHIGPRTNFFELVSDGNMSLLRAVEKFDYMRGNKFSTYATWAVMKNFARTIPEENYRRDRFVTGQEETFDAATDDTIDESEYQAHLGHLRTSLASILVRLDEREREIIVSRFGLEEGHEAETLEQVGRRLGVTKERIRQLQARALGKLRKFADEQEIEVTSLAEPS